MKTIFGLLSAACDGFIPAPSISAAAIVPNPRRPISERRDVIVGSPPFRNYCGARSRVSFFSPREGTARSSAIPSGGSASPLTLPRDRGSGGLDLRLHGVEIEARTLLHWRELDRRHRKLLDLLLDEDETPELVLEPMEILLRAGLGPVLRPSRALEGVEAEIGQIGDVN